MTTVLETLNNTDCFFVIVVVVYITLTVLYTTSVTTTRNLKICSIVFSGRGVKPGCSAPQSKAVTTMDRIKVASSNSIERHPVLRSEIMWSLC